MLQDLKRKIYSVAIKFLLYLLTQEQKQNHFILSQVLVKLYSLNWTDIYFPVKAGIKKGHQFWTIAELEENPFSWDLYAITQNNIRNWK